MIASDGVIEVVDAVGLPAHLRTGWRHSVAWLARSVAHDFHALLATRSWPMPEPLAEIMSRARRSHDLTCDLVSGSPSATVAAWRPFDEKLEYLVLSEASIALLHHQDQVTSIVDHRSTPGSNSGWAGSWR